MWGERSSAHAVPAGARNGCEIPQSLWTPNFPTAMWLPSALQEQCVFLTSEPSLHTLAGSILKWGCKIFPAKVMNLKWRTSVPECIFRVKLSHRLLEVQLTVGDKHRAQTQHFRSSLEHWLWLLCTATLTPALRAQDKELHLAVTETQSLNIIHCITGTLVANWEPYKTRHKGWLVALRALLCCLKRSPSLLHRPGWPWTANLPSSVARVLGSQHVLPHWAEVFLCFAKLVYGLGRFWT